MASWLSPKRWIFSRAAPLDAQAGELMSLRDASRILVRAVRPDDKARLLHGFENLSERSRTLRFCAPKRELNEQELRYLTEFDGHDHLAIGALLLSRELAPEPVGIARFVRLSHDGAVAEAAVAVVDSMQQRGLGRLLMLELGRRARMLGVERFRCFVLSENQAMLALLRSLDENARSLRAVSGTQEVEIKVEGAKLANVLTLPRVLEGMRGRSASSSWSG
jgi:ribosomal protein S18 acetylase RimI-like enzyme